MKSRKSTVDAIGEIDIPMLRERLMSMEPIGEDPYIKVYPYLIEFTSRQKEDIHSLISISHMVYGWMPTIIESRFCEEDSTLWEKIDEGSIEESFLSRLKVCINNSIVGTSKLLHFRNPQQYAIWDSRVFKSVTGREKNQIQMNNIGNFIAYTQRLRFLAVQPGIEDLKRDLIDKGYCSTNASSLRVIELILFYTSYSSHSV